MSKEIPIPGYITVCSWCAEGIQRNKAIHPLDGSRIDILSCQLCIHYRDDKKRRMFAVVGLFIILGLVLFAFVAY